MRIFYQIFALCLVLLVTMMLLIGPAYALPKYPTQDEPEVATPVNVSLHMSSLIDIDSIHENFTCAGYLVYSWKDPEAVDGLIKLEDIWHPSVEIVNFIDHQIIDTIAEAKDGVIEVQERFKIQVSSEFNFDQFPLDQQSLTISLESLNSKNTYFIPGPFTYGKDTFVALSEWIIQGTSSESGRGYYPPEKAYYDRITYRLNVKRKGDYYIYKIILPIVALTVITIITLWLPHNEFSTSMSSILTLVLTGLTLWLLSSDSLPKSQHMSRIDRVVGISVVTQVIVLLLTVGFLERGRKKAIFGNAIQTFIRYFLISIYPIAAYFAAFL